MTPDVVVDIGNTRMKWGWLPPRCDLHDIRMTSLPHDAPGAWDDALAKLNLTRPVKWAAASVHPVQLTKFVAWVTDRGESVTVIDNYRQVPIEFEPEYESPELVGLDRLLNAVAAKRLAGLNTPCLVTDVGTAMTMDVVDDEGQFVGGAILPGPRLMFESLHRYTAKLPLIELGEVPRIDFIAARDTQSAILVGVVAALTGAVREMIEYVRGRFFNYEPWLVLTGGGLGDFAQTPFGEWHDLENCLVQPTLTLEGIHIAAEALP